MNSIAILLQLLFVLYYVYVLYVFYKLHENSCECKKLNKFNKTWNFYYVIFVSSLLLLFNLNHLLKLCSGIQVGGNNDNLYMNTIFIINLGFGASFLNDYAILDLFDLMKKQDCPCQTKNRNYLENMTYVKIGTNIIFYLIIMASINKKTVMKIAKQIKKQQKK